MIYKEKNFNVISYIKETKGVTYSQMAKDLGVSRAYISSILRGKPIGLNFAGKISERYNMLLTEILGYTNGINEPAVAYETTPKVINIASDATQIPMYNFSASASSIEMYNNPNDVQVVGYLQIPGTKKGSFALPVYGHSMYPTLENGSWGILRPISNPAEIVWGEVYYIEWGDYAMYKRLIKCENEDEVTLWSDNQSEMVGDKVKYASQNIKKESIRRLCLLTDIYKKPNY